MQSRGPAVCKMQLSSLDRSAPACMNRMDRVEFGGFGRVRTKIYGFPNVRRSPDCLISVRWRGILYREGESA